MGEERLGKRDRGGEVWKRCGGGERKRIHELYCVEIEDYLPKRRTRTLPQVRAPSLWYPHSLIEVRGREFPQRAPGESP